MAKKQSDTSNDNILAMLAHLLGLFTYFIGPLIIYLIKKDEKGIVKENAKHSLNFQLSLIIYYVIATILMIVLIGFVLMWAIGIFALVVIIIASVRSYEGKVYKYPLEIEFIK
jgi:uncharacterized Tic20 family protein